MLARGGRGDAYVDTVAAAADAYDDTVLHIPLPSRSRSTGSEFSARPTPSPRRLPRAGAGASSQAALAQRFEQEICRAGNLHDIREAVGTSASDALVSVVAHEGFVDTLLNGIISVIVDPIKVILIDGLIGTLMQLIAPFFVQALLIAACAIIPGPVSDQIGSTLTAAVGGAAPNLITMLLAGVVTARVVASMSMHIQTVTIVFLENEAVPLMTGGLDTCSRTGSPRRSRRRSRPS